MGENFCAFDCENSLFLIFIILEMVEVLWRSVWILGKLLKIQ